GEQSRRHAHAATLTSRAGNKKFFSLFPLGKKPIPGLIKNDIGDRQPIEKGQGLDLTNLGEPGIEWLCALQLRAKAVRDDFVAAVDAAKAADGQVLAHVTNHAVERMLMPVDVL